MQQFARLAVLVLFSCGCQSGDGPVMTGHGPEASPAPEPGIIDHEPVLIEVFKPCTFTIPFQNTTPEPLQIVQHTCSCSCADITIPKGEIAPGAEVPITLVAQTMGRFGKQNYTCQLQDQHGNHWPVGVRVTLYHRTQFSPHMLSFGFLEPESTATQTFEFRQFAKSEQDLDPLPTFQSETKTLSLQTGEPRIEQVHDDLLSRVHPVTVTLYANAVEGHNRGSIQAIIPGAKAGPTEATLGIDWNVRSQIKAYPARVVFLPSASTRQEITLESSDGQPFTVSRIELEDNEAIQAEITSAETPEPRHTIVISTHAATDRPRTYRLRLHTTHPQTALVEIPVTVLRVRPKSE